MFAGDCDALGNERLTYVQRISKSASTLSSPSLS
jgi:hypothetical protein